MSRLACTSIVTRKVSSWRFMMVTTAGMITSEQWRASTAMRSIFFDHAVWNTLPIVAKLALTPWQLCKIGTFFGKGQCLA